MLKAIHDTLKQYLSKDLVCPFGVSSIKEDKTFFTTRTRLVELLSLHPIQLQEKLQAYRDYFHKGDGIVVEFNNPHTFTFEQRSPEKTTALQKEVYTAIADTAFALTYVLSGSDKAKFMYLRQNSPTPFIGSCIDTY